MWKLTLGYGYLLYLGAIVFRILHLDLPWCITERVSVFEIGESAPAPPPPLPNLFFLHALWSCVSTHPKNNKPKRLPNNTQ